MRPATPKGPILNQVPPESETIGEQDDPRDRPPVSGDTPLNPTDAIPATLAPTGEGLGGGPGLRGPSRYRVVRPHARGGLGEVFVAVDEELGREVALKEIQGRHADHPESRARFLLEAEVTGQLEHPGIVPVYGLACYPDGRPFYAMRFIRGESLKDAIGRFHEDTSLREDPGKGSLELRKLLERFRDVCNAIAYAHSKGVLHRDLKPDNVMLGAYGETLVVDWGLARVLGGKDEGPGAGELRLSGDAQGSGGTQAGSVLGTPAYMPPEQAAGKLDELGPASDVYSLGATLYHLLTGKPPFADPDVSIVLAKVGRGEFPGPRRVNPIVPAPLEAICLKAMRRKPEDRYPSPRGLADDLEHWLADEPVTAYREPWRARLFRWSRRHRTLITSGVSTLAVAALTLAVLAVLLTAANQREQEARDQAITAKELAEQKGREAQQAKQLADRRLYAAQMNLAQRAWEDQKVDRLLDLLDGQRPERTDGLDLRGFEWHYLHRRVHDDLLTLRGHTGELESVAFSPDGKRILSAASSGNDNSVKVWDAITGEKAFTFRWNDTNYTRRGSFSPDGQLFVAAPGEDGVRVWRASSGKLVREVKTARASCWAVSADNKRLACGGGKEVTVWNLEDGKLVVRFEDPASPVSHVAFSPDGKHLAAATGTNRVLLWELPGGKKVRTLDPYFVSSPLESPISIMSLAFSPDAQWLACSSSNGIVRVWETSKYGYPKEIRAGRRWVTLAFSPDSRRLFTTGYEAVKLWDVASERELMTLMTRPLSPMSRMAFSPDGRRLVTGGSSGGRPTTIKVWDVTVESELTATMETEGRRSSVLALAFSPDGKHLATGNYDKTVALLETVGGMRALSLKGHTMPVFSVAFSPDGKRLASGAGNPGPGGKGPGEVKVWDLTDGKEVLSPRGHSAPVDSVAFSPDGKRLASAACFGWGPFTADGFRPAEVILWDAATGQEQLRLLGHSAGVRCVAFSPDGTMLATSSLDRTVRLWSTTDGEELLTLEQEGALLDGLAFSPDGKRLALIDTMRLRIHDFQSRQTATFKDHVTLNSVAFSPDGKRLLTGRHDGSVKFWDTASGQEVLTLEVQQGKPVWGVAFSPDGGQAAAVGQEGTVKVWDARPRKGFATQEREALGLVRASFEKLLLREDVRAALAEDRQLAPSLRQHALALTQLHPEDPVRLNQASWNVVRSPEGDPAAYRLALRRAEAAARLLPRKAALLNTLGVAQYRAGKYTEAIATLTRSDGLQNGVPDDLAFLALAHFRAGQKEKALAVLDRLRAVMKKPEWAGSKEAQGFLQEAEGLIRGEPQGPRK